MRVIERFQMALGSHLGIVFIGLLIGLTVLGAIYWWLVVRQKRRDLLAYLYRNYYEKVAELAKDVVFAESHKAEFFGRQSVVTFNKGSFAVCLVPPPTSIDAEVKARFRLFHNAKEHLTIPGLAPVLWRSDDGVIAVIEGKVLDARGRFLPTLRHHLFDKKLAATTREQILLQIAAALAQLHEQTTDQGSHLYHGFLLPRSILLDLDPNQRLNGVVITGGGIAFAMGPERVMQQLSSLKLGKMPVEKYCAQEIMEQMAILAPEEKSSDRLHEVGPKSDLYAFGAIAVSLLLQQRFTSPQHVDWNRIPKCWAPFLKSCLSDVVDKRPADFLELEDWLNDPELALTHVEVATTEKSVTSADVPLDSLLTTMLKRHSVDDELSVAIKAIKSGKWPVAKKSLQQVLAADPTHALAHAYMAIACYELDEKKKAEAHYDKAKSADPQAAKCFRQHLAFRL